MNVETLKRLRKVLALATATATVSSLIFAPNSNGNVMIIPSKIDGRTDETKSKKGVKDKGTSKKQHLDTELVYTRHSSNPYDSQMKMDHRFTNRNVKNEVRGISLYEQRGKEQAAQMARQKCMKKRARALY